MSDQPDRETKVEQIVRHVLSARQIVARQRQLVARRKAAGHQTADSEQLLRQFERTLAIFEQELVEAGLPASAGQ